jgi:hypothetical protein
LQVSSPHYTLYTYPRKKNNIHIDIACDSKREGGWARYKTTGHLKQATGAEFRLFNYLIIP